MISCAGRTSSALSNSENRRFHAGSEYQGTALAVPKSPLFLLSRSDFSPRGIRFEDFFNSLFSPAVSGIHDVGL